MPEAKEGRWRGPNTHRRNPKWWRHAYKSVEYLVFVVSKSKEDSSGKEKVKNNVDAQKMEPWRLAIVVPYICYHMSTKSPWGLSITEVQPVYVRIKNESPSLKHHTNRNKNRKRQKNKKAFAPRKPHQLSKKSSERCRLQLVFDGEEL